MREISLKTERGRSSSTSPSQCRRRSTTSTAASAALVYVPHTTAGVTINEHADPAVARDLEAALEQIVGDDWGWEHIEDGRRTRRRTCARRCMGPQVLVPLRDGAARARHLAGHLLLRVRRPARPHGLRDDARVIEVDRADEAVRLEARGGLARLPRAARDDHRLPRPERRGQDDHAALPARAGPADRRARRRSTAVYRELGDAEPTRRRRARGLERPSGALRAQPPARARRRRRRFPSRGSTR